MYTYTSHEWLGEEQLQINTSNPSWAAGTGLGKLRDQMLNSVVEKRRFGLSAHPAAWLMRAEEMIPTDILPTTPW